jgi:hypothetical protein
VNGAREKSLQFPFLYVASFSFLLAKKGLPNPKAVFNRGPVNIDSVKPQSEALLPSERYGNRRPMWILSYK